MRNYLSSNNGFDRSLRFFDDAFDGFFRPVFSGERLGGMKTDIKESENNYLFEVEMPGFDKKDISLTLENGYLSVSAEKKEESDNEENKGCYLRQERSFSCSRRYYVGNVEQEDIKAKYENGILTIDVPKEDHKKISSNKINID